MPKFLLLVVRRWFVIKSQSSELILLFTAICTLLKNSRHFHIKYFIYFWIAKKNFTSGYILAHLGFFIHLFYDSPNNLPLWYRMKTHRGISKNRKFDMKTMIKKMIK
jgi:hypothetical protein